MMISSAEAFLLNEMLQELHQNNIDKIRRKLLVDVYGIKYTIYRIKTVEHFEDVTDNKSPFFVTDIEIALYGKDNKILGTYSLPISAAKSNNVSRAVKDAYKVWKETIERKTDVL